MNDVLKEIISFMIFFFIVAIIFTFIYICYFIQCKNTSIFSLIISFVFLSLFFFLNFLVLIDFSIFYEKNEIYLDKVIISLISNFYKYFNRCNTFMTLLFFPFMIRILFKMEKNSRTNKANKK